MTLQRHSQCHAPGALRLALLCTRQVLGSALPGAVLVGSLLVFVHHGDAIFTGHITGRVVLKALLTCAHSLLCHAAGRSPQQQYCRRYRSVAAGVEDRETEPHHCNCCGGQLSLSIKAMSSRLERRHPGVRQDAHNACGAFCVSFYGRLCDVSESCCHAPGVTWQGSALDVVQTGGLYARHLLQRCPRPRARRLCSGAHAFLEASRRRERGGLAPSASPSRPNAASPLCALSGTTRLSHRRSRVSTTITVRSPPLPWK